MNIFSRAFLVLSFLDREGLHQSQTLQGTMIGMLVLQCVCVCVCVRERVSQALKGAVIGMLVLQCVCVCVRERVSQAL